MSNKVHVTRQQDKLYNQAIMYVEHGFTTIPIDEVLNPENTIKVQSLMNDIIYLNEKVTDLRWRPNKSNEDILKFTYGQDYKKLLDELIASAKRNTSTQGWQNDNFKGTSRSRSGGKTRKTKRRKTKKY